MNNPWLDVPLADYEGHMALPGIEQAQLLSDIFADVLAKFSPRSVAVIGCAGVPAGQGHVSVACASAREPRDECSDFERTCPAPAADNCRRGTSYVASWASLAIRRTAAEPRPSTADYLQSWGSFSRLRPIVLQLTI
jgi:hypothetical protein